MHTQIPKARVSVVGGRFDQYWSWNTTQLRLFYLTLPEIEAGTQPLGLSFASHHFWPCIDYKLGNLESKSICSPKFSSTTILQRFSTKWQYQALRWPPFPLLTLHHTALCVPSIAIAVHPLRQHHHCLLPIFCRATIICCLAPSQLPLSSAAALHCPQLPAIGHHHLCPTPLSASRLPSHH